MEKAKVGTIGEEGNTEPLPQSLKKKQPDRKTFYTFTLFKYEDIELEFNRQLKSLTKKYLYGHEICGETGRPHLQGFFALKKAMRITEIKLIGHPHLEVCKGNEEQNVRYCTKENNNIIKYGYPKPVNIITELRPFQKKVEDIYMTEPDDRKIYWFWESTGNIGKSSLVKYMVVKHQCLFCDGGKKSDLINLVFNADMDNCKAIIWDLPRSSKGNISYATLESIKNGLVCNTKYETGVKAFNAPHIFVFANFPPEEPEKLSSDRWVIEEL
jgi:hypothetical protein